MLEVQGAERDLRGPRLPPIRTSFRVTAIIWVEGPSDRLYIRSWIESLRPVASSRVCTTRSCFTVVAC